MKNLKYILAGALVLTPLFSQAAVTGKTATGTSVTLPGAYSKGKLGNKERGRFTPSGQKIRDDLNQSGNVVEDVAGDRAFQTPGDLLKGVVQDSDDNIVIGRSAEKEENKGWFAKAGGVAWKVVTNFFPEVKADTGALQAKIANIKGAFDFAIRESTDWDPETRNNLGELIEQSHIVGISQAIEEVKGIPAEDKEAQRNWLEDMKCKCNPAACAI